MAKKPTQYQQFSVKHPGVDVAGNAATGLLLPKQYLRNPKIAGASVAASGALGAAHVAWSRHRVNEYNASRPVGARKVSSHQPDRSIDKHPSVHAH